VAGVRDTSATFYNPAALALVESPSISVSANALRYGQLTIDNALGERQDLQATLLAPIPLLASGLHRFQGAPEWAFGYAILTRQLYSGSFSDQVNMLRDVPVPGETPVSLPAQTVTQVSTSSQANEFWAMGAAAGRITNTLAVGIAPILALRNQSRLDRFSFTTIPNGPAGELIPTSTSHTTDISFYQLSFLARLGVAWEPTTFLKLGATVTTPNLKITGRGEVLGATELVNLPVAGAGSVTTVGNDAQHGLSTHYRMPFSVALGTEVTPWSALTLGVTVEYSAALGRAKLLDVKTGRPFFRGAGADLVSSSDSAAFLTPFDQRQAVLNVSVGVEYALNTMYTAYVGFWTDFSPSPGKQVRDILIGNSGFLLPTASIDLYHLVFGATRTIQRGKIAAGVVLSHGTGTSQSDVDITTSGTIAGTSAQGPIPHAVSFSSLSFLLGYTYFF
jgi:hypothetical protein